MMLFSSDAECWDCCTTSCMPAEVASRANSTESIE